MRTSCSGFSKGSGLRRTASKTVKMAVLAPIPSARVRTAIRVNPGDFLSSRRAKRKSVSIRSMFVRQSFGVQRDDRIDAAGAPRGNPAGEGYAQRKDDGGAEP